MGDALSEEDMLELSRDSEEATEDALPTEEEERPGLDALELSELEASEPASLDKEETESGLDASLEEEESTEPELSEDTEVVPAHAQSTPTEEEPGRDASKEGDQLLQHQPPDQSLLQRRTLDLARLNQPRQDQASVSTTSSTAWSRPPAVES